MKTAAKERLPYIKPRQFNPPKPETHMVWCPLCDWKHPDNHAGRKRMGMHLADRHYDQIVFKKGTEPPDLEER